MDAKERASLIGIICDSSDPDEAGYKASATRLAMMQGDELVSLLTYLLKDRDKWRGRYSRLKVAMQEMFEKLKAEHQ